MSIRSGSTNSRHAHQQPPVHAVHPQLAADGLFHVVRLESAPRDYVYTQREWIRRLRRIEAELTQEFGAELVRRHIEYFENNINGYLIGALSLVRMALERRGPHVGWNMAKSVKFAR